MQMVPHGAISLLNLIKEAVAYYETAPLMEIERMDFFLRADFSLESILGKL